MANTDNVSLLNSVCDYETLESVARSMQQVRDSNIFMMHINIVSLLKNYDKMMQLLSTFPHKLDAICISETRLKDHLVNSVHIPGYNLFYSNSCTSAGGAAIYVSDNLNARELLHYKLSISNVEDVWLELSKNATETITHYMHAVSYEFLPVYI